MDQALKLELTNQSRLDATSPVENFTTRAISSAFLGAAVTLATLVALGLLGTGISLLFVDFNAGLEIEVWKLVALGVGLVVGLAAAYFVGGYAANCAARFLGKRETLFLAVAAWAVTTSVLVLGFGGKISSGAAGFVAGANASGGAGLGLEAFFGEIEKAQSRVISDVKLLKGKVVSYFAVEKKKEGAPPTPQEVEKARVMRESAEKAKTALSLASLGGFFAIAFSLLTSLLGVRLLNSKT